MNCAVGFFFLSVVCMLSSNAFPMLEENLYDVEEYEPQVRERRSPQGKFDFDAKDEKHNNGERERYLRGEYTHKWGDEKGPHAEANVHYQRNWDNGPREQHGGRVRITIPIGQDK